MANQVNRGSPLAAIRIAEFKNLMLGRFVFIMALRMMSTLVGWWIYELTRDPFAIGLIGLSEVIPAVSMALYAGHVIDLSEKRKLILKGLFFYFCCAAVLLFLSTNLVKGYLDNHWIAVCIYAVIFCTGITRSFTGPTFTVLLAYIVPKQHLQNATTWSQGTWLTASVTGHALGGFLIAAVGNTGTLITICCLLVFAFTILTRLKPQKALLPASEKRTWESVKEGLRFVGATRWR